jgi:hypothetical protein
MALFFMVRLAQINHHIEPLIDARVPMHANDQRRLALLDDRRAIELSSRR